MTNQEAIEHIKNIKIYSFQDGYTDEAREALDMAIKALEAQELSNNSPKLDSEFGDLISRQDAIDALKNRWKKTRNYEGNGDDIAEECELYLKQVPSAQPEQHTCVNCGRTANNGGWYADGRTRCPIEEHYALPKDGYCHLWEKRNITDDDYPERREE